MSPKSFRHKASPENALGCYTGELYVVHNMFRQDFSRAIDLLEAVDPTDQARVERVARHLLDITNQLHNHHLHEDVTVWDVLDQRSPDTKADIARLREEHRSIGHLVDKLTNLIPQWEIAPEKKDELAATLKQFQEELVHHLDDEEKTMMPLASRFMKQVEWDSMSRMGKEEIPRQRLIYELGHILNAAPTEELRQEFWKKLPLPARIMYQLIGKKQYEKEIKELYGPLNSK